MEIYELPTTQANICLAIAALDVWIEVNRMYIYVGTLNNRQFRAHVW